MSGSNNFNVILGRHDLRTNAGESHRVKNVFVHPNYNSQSMENDIAVIELATPSSVTPIALDKTDRATVTHNGVMSKVVGWGTLTEGGESPDKIYQVGLPIVSRGECNKGYGGSIVGSMLCAGFKQGGKDSCQGDSGGPLFIGSGSAIRQVGVVSWGEGCAQRDRYGVYTRVSHFIEYVEGITSGNGSPQTPAPPPSPTPSMPPSNDGPGSPDGSGNGNGSGNDGSGNGSGSGFGPGFDGNGSGSGSGFGACACVGGPGFGESCGTHGVDSQAWCYVEGIACNEASSGTSGQSWAYTPCSLGDSPTNPPAPEDDGSCSEKCLNDGSWGSSCANPDSDPNGKWCFTSDSSPNCPGFVYGCDKNDGGGGNGSGSGFDGIGSGSGSGFDGIGSGSGSGFDGIGSGSGSGFDGIGPGSGSGFDGIGSGSGSGFDGIGSGSGSGFDGIGSGSGSGDGGELLLKEDFLAKDQTLEQLGWKVVDAGETQAPSDWKVAFMEQSVKQSQNIRTRERHKKNKKLGTRLVYAPEASLPKEWGHDYSFGVQLSSTDNDMLGVFLRYQDDDNFLRVSFDSQERPSGRGGPPVRLVQFVDGNPTLLAESQWRYSKERWYDVETIVVGELCVVIVDGEVVLESDEVRVPSGDSSSVGLYSFANRGSTFSAVRVMKREAPAIDVTPGISAPAPLDMLMPCYDPNERFAKSVSRLVLAQAVPINRDEDLAEAELDGEGEDDEGDSSSGLGTSGLAAVVGAAACTVLFAVAAVVHVRRRSAQQKAAAPKMKSPGSMLIGGPTSPVLNGNSAMPMPGAPLVVKGAVAVDYVEHPNEAFV